MIKHTGFAKPNFLFIACSVLAVGGCETAPPPAPPSGWIKYDTGLTRGEYLFPSGSRWIGGEKNGKFDGKGTIYYPDMREIPKGFRNAAVTWIAKDNEWVAGPIAVTAPDSAKDYLDGFVFQGTTDGIGFKGPGVLVQNNGLRMTGEFDYSSMPIGIIVTGGFVEWSNGSLIASHAYGQVKASWPTGAQFEGMIMDFYPFNRSSYDVVCSASPFVGKGMLKLPGKDKYFGFVSDTRTGLPEPVSKEKFLEDISNYDDCPGKALAVQSTLNNRQAQYDAEMKAGRERANAILAADFSELSTKLTNEITSVESASRGSSVEMDKPHRPKVTVLDVQSNNATEDKRSKKSNLSSPPGNSSKNNKPVTLTGNNATSPGSQVNEASAEEGDNTTKTQQPLTNHDISTSPFSESHAYTSDYGCLTEEKAKESVASQRTRYEPVLLGHAKSWTLLSVSSPTCKIRTDIRETGHWVCEITAQYSGVTYRKNRTDGVESSTTKVQER